MDEGAGCSRIGYAGSDNYFNDVDSSSSGSGFSSDSSDPEKEDDRGYLEEAVDRDATEDLAHWGEFEHAQPHTDGQYATACGEMAEEMRDAAAAPALRMFVPKENSFYIKRIMVHCLVGNNRRLDADIFC